MICLECNQASNLCLCTSRNFVETPAAETIKPDSARGESILTLTANIRSIMIECEEVKEEKDKKKDDANE